MFKRLLFTLILSLVYTQLFAMPVGSGDSKKPILASASPSSAAFLAALATATPPITEAKASEPAVVIDTRQDANRGARKRKAPDLDDSHGDRIYLIAPQRSRGALVPESRLLRSMLFRKKTPIKRYAINFMWINQSINEKQPYIHPAKNKVELERNFLAPILKWAHINPNSTINIWFDGALLPAEAITNTMDVIKECCIKNSIIAPIMLKDVRSIPSVRSHDIIFSHPEVPVFFRVDLLRLMITLQSLIDIETKYFVFTDLDVPPLPEEKLFDEETLQILKKFGIVLAKTEHGHEIGSRFENGFHIVRNDKPNLPEAVQFIIDLNISSILNAIKKESYFLSQPKNLEQQVFGCYKLMFKYFYSLENYGVLEIPCNDEKKICLPKASCLPKDINQELCVICKFYEHGSRDSKQCPYMPYTRTFGVKPFVPRTEIFTDDMSAKFTDATEGMSLTRPGRREGETYLWVPTKDVQYPLSRFGY